MKIKKKLKKLIRKIKYNITVCKKKLRKYLHI